MVMKNLKKKIPLVVLETLESFLSKENETVKLIDPENLLLKFIDRDDKSDFYFNIDQYKVEPGKYQLLVEYKPKSKEIIEKHRGWINHTNLDNVFNNWVTIIEKYDKIETIFDDPIERKYQEEFYSEFEILDEDADTVSFNLNQQLFLSNYLEKVILAIDTLNSENESLTEIKEEAIELNENLTTLTKRKVIKKLSIIWAKARKYGLPLLKEIYVQVRNELISQLIKGQLGQ